MRTSVGTLLTSEGLNVAGPYDAVENMTFPEKKGSDLVIYVALDLADGYSIQNMRQEIVRTYQGAKSVVACDIVIGPAGSVQLVAIEPMTSQKRWVKRIDVTQPNQTFKVRGQKICARQAITQEIKDGWGKAHDALYRKTMSSIDRYVNGEEFAVLKKQADELKAKKAF